MSILFLGVGNLHRADDGVGPLLAQRLVHDPVFIEKGVQAQAHSGEGVSLMHLWEGMESVVIVDAMKSGARLGSVRRFDVMKESLHAGVFRYSSHLFGLAEATEMSRHLGRLPRAMIIYGIEGGEFTFGAPMSEPVAASVGTVEAMVKEEITSISSSVLR